MAEPLVRSCELMSRDDTALLVVDVQQKLVPLIDGAGRMVWNIGRLIDAAAVLGVPVFATEQYPRGLGPTVPELASRLEGDVPEKLAFSCGGCAELVEGLRGRALNKVLVCGIETHVCVQQTVFDLLADGWRVYLPVDAVGSRYRLDYETALRRMDSAGVALTTTEAAMFEWCAASGTPEFKAISELVKQSGPEA